MLTKQKLLLRIIAGALSFTFLTSELHAAPIEAFLKLSPAEQILQHPELFEAPENFSILSEIHPGNQNTFIIHIQDAHSNFSGQDNLAKTLEALMKKYDVSLILSEGGYGDCTLTQIKSIAAPSVWKRVARSFLMNGKIQGEEYLNLVSDRPMKIQGIEDEALYRESVEAYRVLAQKREKILANLNKIQHAVEKLKAKLYPKELLEYEKIGKENFELKFKAFLSLSSKLSSPQSSSLSSPKFLIGDHTFGPRFKASGATVLAFRDDMHLGNTLRDFPNLKNLARIQEKEKSIHFETANLELAALLEEISKKHMSSPQSLSGDPDMPGSPIKAFGDDKTKTKGVSLFCHFQNTLNIARQKRIDIERYPNLMAYIDYLKDFSQIDFEKVLTEYERAEDQLYKSILENGKWRMENGQMKHFATFHSPFSIFPDDSLILRGIDRFIGLLISAHKIQMTPDQYAFFKYNEPDFGTESMEGFLNRKLAEQGYFEDMIPAELVLNDGRKALDAFYDSVARRDLAFIRNFEKIISDQDKSGGRGTLAGDAEEGSRHAEWGVPSRAWRETAAAGPARNRARVVVMITGGYHTPHLKKLFQQKCYAYAVLTPIVRSEINQQKYESLLLLEKSNATKKINYVENQTTKDETSALEGDLAKLIQNKKDGVRMALIRTDGARLAELMNAVNPLTKPHQIEQILSKRGFLMPGFMTRKSNKTNNQNEDKNTDKKQKLTTHWSFSSLLSAVPMIKTAKNSANPTTNIRALNFDVDKNGPMTMAAKTSLPISYNAFTSSFRWLLSSLIIPFNRLAYYSGFDKNAIQNAILASNHKLSAVPDSAAATRLGNAASRLSAAVPGSADVGLLSTNARISKQTLNFEGVGARMAEVEIVGGRKPGVLVLSWQKGATETSEF